MKRAAVIALACTFALPLASAQAQPEFEKPDDAIAYRQSALKLLGAHFGGLAPVMRGRAPYDAAQVQAEVAIIQSLASLPWKGFAEGTEGGAARPAVWQDSAKFRELAQAMEGRVAKLAEASRTGDFDTVRAAYGDTANSCRTCHDSFRQRR